MCGIGFRKNRIFVAKCFLERLSCGKIGWGMQFNLKIEESVCKVLEGFAISFWNWPSGGAMFDLYTILSKFELKANTYMVEGFTLKS